MSTTTYYNLTDEVVRTHGARCHLCQHSIDLTIRNGPGSLQVDHVWPQSRGGCHHLANLRPSHRRCNGSRGNRLITRHPICPCAQVKEQRQAQLEQRQAQLEQARAARAARKQAKIEARKWDGKPHTAHRVMGHLVLWLLALNPILLSACVGVPLGGAIVMPLWLLIWVPVVRALWRRCGTRTERLAKRAADDRAKGYTTTVMHSS